MKLGSPVVEKKIRQRVRDELRTSRSAWKEYRRMRKRATRLWPRSVGKAFIIFYVTAVILRSPQTSERLLPALILYCTATVFLRSVNLHRRLFFSDDLAIFLHLPISDEEIFRYEWDGFLDDSLWVLSVAFLADGYVGFFRGTQYGFLATCSFIVFASVLQWLIVLSLVVLILRFQPKWARAEIGAALDSLLVIMIFLPGDLFHNYQHTLLWVPSGWISYAFARSLNGTVFAAILPWVAGLSVAGLLPFALKGLRRAYSTESVVISPAASQFLTGEPPEADAPFVGEEAESSPDSAEAPHPVDVQGTHDSIAQGEFLKPLTWKERGWIEGLAAHFFRGQDGVVAEFMAGTEAGNWSRRWRTAFVISIVGVVATWALPVPEGYNWVLFLPPGVAAMFAAPLLGGPWPGFGQRLCAGRWAPLFSMFPLGYREISRVMFRVNGVRCLLWLPLIVMDAPSLSVRLGGGWAFGTSMATKLFLIVVALQPTLAAGRFSVCTNDTDRVTLSLLIRLPVMAIGITAMIAAGIMTFMPELTLAGIGIGLVFLSSLCIWLGYGYFYNYRGADLYRTTHQ